MTDGNLINLALAGDSFAVNHLITKHRMRIFLQIRTQIGDCSMVNDLVQEVCLKVFRFLPSFKRHSSFTTWLYKITQNTVLNYFRTLKAEFNESLDHIKIENVSSSPEACLVNLEFQQQMNKILLKMPDELQHCFHLYVTQGLSYKAIAKRLHCPLGTVRSRIHRMRHLLKEQITPL